MKYMIGTYPFGSGEKWYSEIFTVGIEPNSLSITTELYNHESSARRRAKRICELLGLELTTGESE